MTSVEHTSRVGWREWLTLPDLNIDAIEAKMDTGTRTSVLHVSFIEPLRNQGELWVRFGVQPSSENPDVRMISFAPVKDQRLIKDSEGHDEVCFIVETSIALGTLQKTIELTLSENDAMRFKMILGRTALQKLNLVVDPNASHLLGNDAAPAEELTCQAG